MKDSGNNSFTTIQDSLLGWFLFLIWGVVGCFYLFVNKPHFEESFGQWKLIMGLSQSYTKSFHKFNDLLLWQEMFEWLYAQKIDIPWFPLALFFLSFVSIGIHGAILWNARTTKIGNRTWFVVVLFAFSFLCVNLLFIHHTRTSFLMMSAGWLLLAFTYYGIQSSAIKLFTIRLLAICWLLGGVLLRPEVGIVLCGFFVAATFFLLQKHFGYRMYVSAIACAVMFLLGYYIYHIIYDSSFYYQLEPDIEYEVMDKHNILPLPANSSAKDCARYEAVFKNWMLADFELNTPEYIRGYIAKPNNLFHRFFFFIQNDSQYISPKFNRFNEEIKGNFWGSIVYLFLLFFLIFQARGVGVFYALFSFSWAAMLLCLSFSVNSFSRVTEPLMGITLAWIVWLYTQLKTSGNNFTTRSNIFIVPFLLLIMYSVFNIHKNNYLRAQSLNATEHMIEQRVENIMLNQADRKYVVFVVDFTFLNTPALTPFTGIQDKELIIPEYGQFSANKAFVKTVSDITHCPESSFSCRLNSLKQIKAKCIIIGKERRIKLYDEYAKSVYGINLNWSSAPRILLAEGTYCWLP